MALDQEHLAVAREIRLGGTEWANGIRGLRKIVGYQPTAAALHTARLLLQNFSIEPKRDGALEPTAEHLAVFIDVCSSMHAVPEALYAAKALLDAIQDETRQQNVFGHLSPADVQRTQIQATAKRAADCFAVLIGIVQIFNRLPAYNRPNVATPETPTR